MSSTELIQTFSSAFGIQQRIFPEQLHQIYIVAYLWKEEILSFLTMLFKQICHLNQILRVELRS